MAEENDDIKHKGSTQQSLQVHIYLITNTSSSETHSKTLLIPAGRLPYIPFQKGSVL